MEEMTNIVGRFVPPSAKDFSIRARRLSLLLDRKLQLTQEQLARWYGFSNAYELRQAMKAPARPVGPFDEALNDHGERRRDALQAQLDQDVPSDAWVAFRRGLVAQMGLFASPQGHDHLHALTQQALTTFQAQDHRGDRPAFVGFSSVGEAVLCWTPSGRRAYDAVNAALEISDGGIRERTMRRLAAEHPENPWVLGDLLDEEIDAAEGARGLLLSIETSRLYQKATEVVRLYQNLYGPHEPWATVESLIVASPFGADSRSYAGSLVVAARLASIAGDHRGALRLTRRLRKMGHGGVERLHQTALLNLGRATPQRRARQPTFQGSADVAAWARLCAFGTYVAADDLMAVRLALHQIILLHGRLELRADLADALLAEEEAVIPLDFSGPEGLATQQFFQATAQLWRSRPETTSLIIDVLRDQVVVRASNALLMRETQKWSTDGQLPISNNGTIALERGVAAAWERAIKRRAKNSPLLSSPPPL